MLSLVWNCFVYQLAILVRHIAATGLHDRRINVQEESFEFFLTVVLHLCRTMADQLDYIP